MYRFNAEDPGQSLYTPTTVGVIYMYDQMISSREQGQSLLFPQLVKEWSKLHSYYTWESSYGNKYSLWVWCLWWLWWQLQCQWQGSPLCLPSLHSAGKEKHIHTLLMDTPTTGLTGGHSKQRTLIDHHEHTYAYSIVG